ncbi:MAG: ECF-type sigma factor [Acidobacteriota bacterium]
MSSPSSNPPQPDPRELTQLLEAHSDGDAAAFERLIELVYPQLYRSARQQLAKQPSETSLGATSLVNEAYLRLVRETGVEWSDRCHFYAVSSLTMRRILVDQARRRRAQKRGSGQQVITLEPEQLSLNSKAELVLAVDEAVDKLEAFNPRLARVVECRYFAGLTNEETASALDVSVRTVERDWLRARAWLADKLEQKG